MPIALICLDADDTLWHNQLWFDRSFGAFARLMEGNSMRSDVLPALAAGAWAVFIPFEGTWAHEDAAPPAGHPRYCELPRLADLAAWVDGIA